MCGFVVSIAGKHGFYKRKGGFHSPDSWCNGRRIIHILDELFDVDLNRVREFCKRIKKYNLFWMVQMRVTCITDEILKVMHDSGCISISYGLESFSSAVLTNMKKFIKPEDIERTLKITYDNNIDIQGNFIFGDEIEDLTTIFETMRFWFSHPEYNISLSVIQTYPGSGYYNELVKKNIDLDAYSQREDWVVNITRYSNETWWKYYIVLNIIDKYYHPKKCLGEIINSGFVDGKWKITVKCGHCGKITKIEDVYSYIIDLTKVALCCPKCNHRSDYILKPERLVNKILFEPLCYSLSKTTDIDEFKSIVDQIYNKYLELSNSEKGLLRLKTIDHIKYKIK